MTVREIATAEGGTNLQISRGRNMEEQLLTISLNFRLLRYTPLFCQLHVRTLKRIEEFRHLYDRTLKSELRNSKRLTSEMW
jgi:hypothetical protein